MSKGGKQKYQSEGQKKRFPLIVHDREGMILFVPRISVFDAVQKILERW